MEGGRGGGREGGREGGRDGGRRDALPSGFLAGEFCRAELVVPEGKVGSSTQHLRQHVEGGQGRIEVGDFDDLGNYNTSHHGSFARVPRCNDSQNALERYRVHYRTNFTSSQANGQS
jgi:hypothetical protein